MYKNDCGAVGHPGSQAHHARSNKQKLTADHRALRQVELEPRLPREELQEQVPAISFCFCPPMWPTPEGDMDVLRQVPKAGA